MTDIKIIKFSLETQRKSFINGSEVKTELSFADVLLSNEDIFFQHESQISKEYYFDLIFFLCINI